MKASKCGSRHQKDGEDTRAECESIPKKKRRIHTTYICYFAAQVDAAGAADEMRARGLRAVKLWRDETSEEWLISGELAGRPDLGLEQDLQEMAAGLRGGYDGNLVGPFT